MSESDTIVALSSGGLPSGVAVVRVSGRHTKALLEDLTGSVPPPRRMVHRRIGRDDLIDRGLVVHFPAPASFTGEDCAEFQVHGSPAVVRALLRALTECNGVRLASAGEFTRRAFENGRLDLAQAQGLADLLAAETDNQRRLAMARAEGGLSRRIETWRERLLDLRAEIESQLDFSDEGDVGALPDDFAEDVRGLANDIRGVLATRGQGRIIRSGFRVVLAGPPNVGKSSLLNALSQSDVAIVSDEAGTTRDLKEVPLDLNGQLVILIDSAGLRETDSRAEAIGVDRALGAMRDADLILWLQAPDQARAERPVLGVDPAQHPPVLVIGTKSDLGPVASADLSLSAETGEGIAALLDYVERLSGNAGSASSEILVSHEQDRQALMSAYTCLEAVPQQLDRSELAAEGLRQASGSLERLLGIMDAESVLDRLFAQFCIGK
jgi:tRNA modification GTPase